MKTKFLEQLTSEEIRVLHNEVTDSTLEHIFKSNEKDKFVILDLEAYGEATIFNSNYILSYISDVTLDLMKEALNND